MQVQAASSTSTGAGGRSPASAKATRNPAAGGTVRQRFIVIYPNIS